MQKLVDDIVQYSCTSYLGLEAHIYKSFTL